MVKRKEGEVATVEMSVLEFESMQARGERAIERMCYLVAVESALMLVMGAVSIKVLKRH